MTKSLTEKWKDMDLADEHLYYWRMPNGEVRIMSKIGAYSYKFCYDGDKIDILAPVPTYDEFVQQRDFVKDHQKVLIENMNLKQKLEIATKAFHEIMDGVGTGKYDDYAVVCCCNDALIEMEGVK